MAFCGKKAAKATTLKKEKFLDVSMKLGDFDLEFSLLNGTWTNKLDNKTGVSGVQSVQKKLSGHEKPVIVIEQEDPALKQKEEELEERLRLLEIELENQRHIARQLQKEFLLTEIRNELLTQIAVEKNSKYNTYVHDIEEHK